MTELTVLAVFAAALILCIVLDLSVLTALVFGFFLFLGYGLYRKHSLREMLSMAFSGIKTVKNILITFLLIGIITAVWRAGGTIPCIVYHAAGFCDPRAMVLITFLLCGMISCLTGTAFGTAATMGVICVTMAGSMGIPILLTGGAVLAGSFFGDRCSPMSTSALLVSTLTKTDLFRNIRGMVKTSLVPFFLSCVIFALMGLGAGRGENTSDIREIFSENFSLHPTVLIPAAVIVLLSAFRVNVKITMTVSILCGAAVCLFVQKIPPMELLRFAVMGYTPENGEVGALLSGGGLVSMLKSVCIICISSCYSGMFSGTGLLDGIQNHIEKLSRRLTPFGGILVTAVLTAMIACNQTLGIMLTHQLCGDTEKDPQRMALALENTSVVVNPLIPWSIASAVPLSSAGAPAICVLTAVYLWLLPLWNWCMALWKKKKASKH